MSKLPDFLKPAGQFSLYGVSVDDMDREDLLKVIQWLVDDVEHYKRDVESTSARLNAEVVKTLGPPPKFDPIPKWIRSKL